MGTHTQIWMSRAEYEQWAEEQDAFIADQDMVLIEGYIGPGDWWPQVRRPGRLIFCVC